MQTRVLRKNADVAWMRSHATTILGQTPGKTVNNSVGLVFVHLVERHLPDAERLIVGEHPAGGVSGSCRFPFLPEELESLTAWLQAYAAKATLDYRCNGSYHSLEIANGEIVSHTERTRWKGRPLPLLHFSPRHGTPGRMLPFGSWGCGESDVSVFLTSIIPIWPPRVSCRA